MSACTFQPITSKKSYELALKRNQYFQSKDTSRVSSNKEKHKTYEERHDDPNGFTFQPQINMKSKKIVSQSPSLQNLISKPLRTPTNEVEKDQKTGANAV